MQTDASGVRLFFAALAIPLTAALILAMTIWLVGPRGPLLALTLNAFLLSEVAGFSRALTLPMPERFLRLPNRAAMAV
jgi:hypothetical protein